MKKTSERRSVLTARSLILGAMTILLLIGALLLTRLDVRAISDAARELSASSLLISLLLLLVGALLAAVRLQWIAADIGTPLGFRDAMLALSLGQIAGAISIQFFGQIAARTALLDRRGISSSANIVMVTYERAAAVFVSAGMAIGGIAYLFGKLSFDLETGGAQLVTIVAGILCTVLVGACTVWGQFTLPLLRELVTAKIGIALLRNATLTGAIQLCTAGAYVVIGHNLAGNIPIENLFAASMIVMFAASLPISFSGWGMREVSAIFALGAIGITSPVALTIAIVVGALAFSSVIVLAGVAAMKSVEMPEQNATEGTQVFGLATLLKWALPVAAATAVYFQIYLPTGDTILNVNLGDPIALLGGFVFLIEYGKKAKWRMPAVPVLAAIWTAVLLAAYLHGYFVFGSNYWASINRLLGWIILLCYFLSGALIVAHAPTSGAAILARTLAATACGIVGFWAVLIFMNRLGVQFPSGVLHAPLQGFSQNRNAFSFALLVAVSVLPFIEPRHRAAILATLAFGIWVAGSYAALGTFAVVLGLLIYLRVLSLRSVVLAMIATAGAVALFQFVSLLSNYADGFRVMDVSWRSSSNLERFTSMKGGLALFLTHPIFGAGLGYFIQTQVSAGVPLVIHSTPIWLLAEMGLLGLLTLVVPAIWLYVREFKRGKFDLSSQVIVLCLTAFGIMSQVHELLYQRPMWLLLGAVLLMTPSKRPVG